MNMDNVHPRSSHAIYRGSPRWYEGLTAAHWMVLAVASAGWVFDVYEGQLFAIFKTPMLKELAGGDAAAVEWQGNLGLAAFLLGGAAGGLFFSMLGDRFGRVRMMAVTILVYSVFSALTYFAQSPMQVLVLRFLVAWAQAASGRVAAALVAEHFRRTSARPPRVFFMRPAFWAPCSGITDRRHFERPGMWRWAFLLGLAPSLLVLWIRLGIREPERWVKAANHPTAWRPTNLLARQWPTCNPHRNSRAALGDLRELFGVEPWRTRALLGLGLATVGLATFWGSSPGVPSWSVSSPTIASAGASDSHGKPNLSPHELHGRPSWPLVVRPAGFVARASLCVCRLSRRSRDRGPARFFVRQHLCSGDLPSCR